MDEDLDIFKITFEEFGRKFSIELPQEDATADKIYEAISTLFIATFGEKIAKEYFDII
jgi:hypothetical protein